MTSAMTSWCMYMSMDQFTGTVGAHIATGNSIIQDYVREDQVTVELSGVEV